MKYQVTNRKFWLTLIVSAGLLSFGSLTRAEDDPPAEDKSKPIQWFRSLDQGLADASTTGQHVLVEFYTEWCRWCRAMEDSTFIDPEVRALDDRLVFVRVNAESDTALARKHNIRAYPVYLLLTPDGQEVDRIIGYHPPGKFRKLVKDYLAGRGTMWDLERQLRADPKDMRVVFAMARKHKARGNSAEARAQYDKIVKNDKHNTYGVTDDALFALARMEREDGRWYKAIQKFLKVAEEYPNSDLRESVEAYIPWLYQQAGDTAQALTHYRAFVKEFKDSRDREWAEEQISKLEPESEEE